MEVAAPPAIDHESTIHKSSTVVSSVDSNKKLRIWKVVKPIFLESLNALLLNAGVLAFFGTTISIPLFTVSLGMSLGLSCLFILRDAFQKKTALSPLADKQVKATHLIAKGSLVNTIGLSKPNIYIHEGGHFVAANMLFKGPNAVIWDKPYFGGGTSYTASNRLTRLGKIFGKSGSMTIVAAAGLAASALFISGELIAAHKIWKKHPTASQYMNLHAITHLFNEVIYGLMAFAASKKDLGHDLVRLWRIGGIHPVIPISLLIALPLLTKIIFCHKLHRKTSFSVCN